ncbi:NADP-dependent oxidoreductase [Actinoplanes sp. RD1]|uniref:NADP-dependent oxidoreductase n=1 Tax=Actinoplanes sp. RD1 TaxID=3064538 RepID=UPI002742215C|nr:NADP-dependent oxidoreductase [Actinoplanes sp. RD1]
MRAARIHEYGGPEVVRIDDVPQPFPARGEALIRVVATSLNPTEAALRGGKLAGMFPVEFPLTLGWDVAGTVGGVPVIGMLDHGAAAGYAVGPEERLVAAPRSVPLADAAVLPLAGMTAWQAVVEHARVVAGERVLINGAGGGIGTFAVQIAKHLGAYVVATASPRSAATVRRLGADVVLDYTAGPLEPGRPVDAVVNCAAIGADAARALPGLVRAGGRVVTVATPVEPTAEVRAWHMVVRNSPGDLKTLAGLVDAGTITLDISDRRDLADLPELHRLAEAGAVRGKVLVTTQQR